MVFVSILALLLSNALQAFNILLQIGAGTGLLFILRWFWWRINPYSEISAMLVSFFVAIYFQAVHPHLGLAPISTAMQLLSGVVITTIVWLTVTYFTSPSDDETLFRFYNLVHPGGPGWKKVIGKMKEQNLTIKDYDKAWDVPQGILNMVLGCFGVYGTLFATGNWLYGNHLSASILTVISIAAIYGLFVNWKKMRVDAAA